MWRLAITIVQLMLDIMVFMLTPRRGPQGHRGTGVDHLRVPCASLRSSYRGIGSRTII